MAFIPRNSELFIFDMFCHDWSRRNVYSQIVLFCIRRFGI
jgi:hypothetical protein